MLAHPTLDQLNALGLYGLAKGFKYLEHKPDAHGLDHAEWLGLLLEYETTLRRQKQFEARARAAKLRHGAWRSRTSTIKIRAGSTGRCSSSSPLAAGSPSAAIS